jgi:hypothetical protein
LYPVGGGIGVVKRDARELSGAFVSEIYAALVGNGGWQEFLDRLTGILPNGKATLFYHDLVAGSGALSLNSQLEQEAISSCNQHYCKKNPWISGATTRPLRQGIRAEQLLAQEDLLRTEFYTRHAHIGGLEAWHNIVR